MSTPRSSMSLVGRPSDDGAWHVAVFAKRPFVGFIGRVWLATSTVARPPVPRAFEGAGRRRARSRDAGARSGAMPTSSASGAGRPTPSARRTSGTPTSTAGTFGRPPPSPLRPATVRTTPTPTRSRVHRSPYDDVPGATRQPRSGVRVSDGTGAETPRRMSLVERQATYAKSPAGTPRRGDAGEASSSGAAGSTPTRPTRRVVTPSKSPRESPREPSPLESPAKSPAKASKKASSKSPKTERRDEVPAPAPAPSRPPPPPESPAGYLGQPFRYDFGDDDDGGGSAPRVPWAPRDAAGAPREKTAAAPPLEKASAPALVDPPRPPRPPSAAAASTSAPGSLHDTHVLTERLHASETARREAERRLARASERARVMEEILEEQNALLENVPTVIAAGGAERWRARLGAGGGYGAESTGVRRRLEQARGDEGVSERDRERAIETSGVKSLARRVAELEKALAAKEAAFSKQTSLLESLEVEHAAFDADLVAMRLDAEASRRAAADAGKRAREASERERAARERAGGETARADAAEAELATLVKQSDIMAAQLEVASLRLLTCSWRTRRMVFAGTRTVTRTVRRARRRRKRTGKRTEARAGRRATAPRRARPRAHVARDGGAGARGGRRVRVAGGDQRPARRGGGERGRARRGRGRRSEGARRGNRARGGARRRGDARAAEEPGGERSRGGGGGDRRGRASRRVRRARRRARRRGRGSPRG